MAKVTKEAAIKAIAKLVFTARKERKRHPEGRSDNGGRWYPSKRENLDGYSNTLRSPSRDYPWSYMTGARTLKHCVALVELAIAGEEVPADVGEAIVAWYAQASQQTGQAVPPAIAKWIQARPVVAVALDQAAVASAEIQ